MSVDHDRCACLPPPLPVPRQLRPLTRTCRQPNIQFLPPPAIYAQIVEYGQEKALMPFWKMFWLGMLGGIYLSMGVRLLLSLLTL